MKLLNLTLSAAENLALDEALLEQAEASESFDEVLRLWEPTSSMVVLGRSSPLAQEVNTSFCASNEVDVFRRTSGGQAIVTGPGCLMYAVLLDYRQRPQLRSLDMAHKFVMEKILAAVRSLGIDAIMEGTSDLTYMGRKFSGNALRCKRNWMIYHGTVICDFDIGLIANCLGKPKREPEYRRARSHSDFLTQLPAKTNELKAAIAEAWKADQLLEPLPDGLMDRTQYLADEKYRTAEWLNKVL
jgi:lipoate-protein ligase A